MSYKFGAYLIIPFKYTEEFEASCTAALKPYILQTMDINESVKSLFDREQ